jgi:hypothetical protein
VETGGNVGPGSFANLLGGAFVRILSDVRSMHVLLHIQVCQANSRSFLERAQILAFPSVGHGSSFS